MVTSPKLRLLQHTIQRLMRRSALGPLQKVLSKSHAADLALVMASFTLPERQQLLEGCTSDERRAEILALMDSTLAAELLVSLPRERAASLLAQMEPDDATNIVRYVDQEIADELLNKTQVDTRAAVEDLSRYEEGTAGAIMSPRVFALRRETTAREAIEALQHLSDELEMVFYVYVVNEVDQLLGVVSLRQLVTTKPDTRLLDMMTSDVISVKPVEDQESVARLAARYGLLALPVVDDSNKLLGIVTVDDMIDVLQEEANEDLLRMAGAGDAGGEELTLAAALTQRLPWLVAAVVGGVAAAGILATYAATWERVKPVVLFIPLVLGLCGVIGMQSAAVVAMRVIRGHFEKRWLQVARNIAVGASFGAACGLVLALAVWIWCVVEGTFVNPGGIALLLGVGVATALSCAAAVGTLLPLAFSRINVDPAWATGPTVAIIVDLIGLSSYLGVTHLWI